jgi:hypothetical protein
VTEDKRIFADAVVGERLDDVPIEITEELVRRHFEWGDGPDAWWVESALAGEATVPPSIFEGVGMRAVHTNFIIGSGIITHFGYQCFQPVRIGQLVTAQSTVADRFERRGRSYVVIESKVVDEIGQVIALVDNTIFQRVDEPDVVAGAR